MKSAICNFLLLLLASAGIAAAADNSPDTIAKYLAGLAVPATIANPVEDSSRRASDSPGAETAEPIEESPPRQPVDQQTGDHPPQMRTPEPEPAPTATASPAPTSIPRPGSLIPNRTFIPSPSLSRRSETKADSSSSARPQSEIRSPISEIASSNPWLLHSAELDRAWKQKTNAQLTAIANWAPSALGRAYQSTGTMFYMFSGPDFLYAHAFFPNAHTYILVGNEPVGPIPDLTRIQPNELPIALANIRKSLESVLSWSFFITKNMKTDLAANPQLSGTLPLLYIFLARANCTIDSVTPVTVDNNGVVSDATGQGETKGTTPGVRIVFRSSPVAAVADRGNPNSEIPSPSTISSPPSTQTLYYFSTDLSDDGIKSTPGLMKFCEQQKTGDGSLSLLKAASYLMHESGFSMVREFLLGNSTTIIQDDSGIPFRFFSSSSALSRRSETKEDPSSSPPSSFNVHPSSFGGPWTIQLYGPYVGPIDVFKQYWQQDLANEHARNPTTALPFGFGYNWGSTKSNLMVATRR